MKTLKTAETQQMEFSLSSVLSIVLASFVVLVVAHLSAFFVIRRMYPPQPVPTKVADWIPPAPAPPPEKEQSFVHPSMSEQHVDLPTYEHPVRTNDAPPRETGTTSLSDLVTGSATERNTGMVDAVTHG